MEGMVYKRDSSMQRPRNRQIHVVGNPDDATGNQTMPAKIRLRPKAHGQVAARPNNKGKGKGKGKGGGKGEPEGKNDLGLTTLRGIHSVCTKCGHSGHRANQKSDKCTGCATEGAVKSGERPPYACNICDAFGTPLAFWDE